MNGILEELIYTCAVMVRQTHIHVGWRSGLCTDETDRPRWGGLFGVYHAIVGDFIKIEGLIRPKLPMDLTRTLKTKVITIKHAEEDSACCHHEIVSFIGSESDYEQPIKARAAARVSNRCIELLDGAVFIKRENRCME